MEARKSANGMLYHTPLTPSQDGRNINPGSRKSNCLVSERNMDFLAIPRLWKKLVVTI